MDSNPEKGLLKGSKNVGRTWLAGWSAALGVSAIFASFASELAVGLLFGFLAALSGVMARRGLKRGRSRVIAVVSLVGITLGGLSLAFGMFINFQAASISNHPKPSWSSHHAAALASALENYESEYSRSIEYSSPVSTDSPDGAALLRTLLGDDSGTGNSGGIRFLSVRDAVHGRDGLVYDLDGDPVALVDKWGRPFTIFKTTSERGVNQIRYGSKQYMVPERFAVVSPGSDGKSGTKDDVKSW
ncbi:MAG: hypothetical protein KDN05_20730 [Verrucomicrobiae bacterium]|nr:hypothetical protein [Verrucomicrobiae bacterium]MCP5532090.1 hypothetical protein [Akkermansiaceae bacterium]